MAAPARLIERIPPGTVQITPECWCLIKDGDPDAFAMYRRHYSSAKNPTPKIRQCVGPGTKLLLMTPDASALWAWRRYRQNGSDRYRVECAIFHREDDCPWTASLLILEAERVAKCRFTESTYYTWVDPAKLPKGKRPGYCFEVAGWYRTGVVTKGGLIEYATYARPI